MYQFKRVRIFLVQIDTGDAGIINLAEELVPIRTSLVIYPGRGKQAYFVAVLFSATNAACRKEGGHGVVDGLLHVRKAVRSLVRPSESVRPGFLQFLVYRFDVVGRQDAI